MHFYIEYIFNRTTHPHTVINEILNNSRLAAHSEVEEEEDIYPIDIFLQYWTRT